MLSPSENLVLLDYERFCLGNAESACYRLRKNDERIIGNAFFGVFVQPLQIFALCGLFGVIFKDFFDSERLVLIVGKDKNLPAFALRVLNLLF